MRPKTFHSNTGFMIYSYDLCKLSRLCVQYFNPFKEIFAFGYNFIVSDMNQLVSSSNSSKKTYGSNLKYSFQCLQTFGFSCNVTPN